jgi:hypothetical protein
MPGDERSLRRGLFFFFSGWLAVITAPAFCCYAVAYFVAGEPGVEFATFLETYGFVRMFMVGFTMAAFLTGLFGIVAWIANRKSAKEWNRVERLIDAWVVSLSRAERDR